MMVFGAGFETRSVHFAKAMKRHLAFPGMSGPTDAKMKVNRAENDDKLAMLKELAKLTKPTGKSAQGKSVDGNDD